MVATKVPTCGHEKSLWFVGRRRSEQRRQGPALPVAALEHSAVGTRNLPLLLDELFVHFDDDRTRAGLLLLEQLSFKMQMLLCTHHERVAAQATDAISSDKLRV
jgi:recombinational DNA repair ATPase RecF